MRSSNGRLAYGTSGNPQTHIMQETYAAKIFAEETEEYRPDGLPDGLVAVENCDEWLYCIDCSNGKVVSWSPYDDDGVVEVYEDFDSYLLDRFNDAIENM